MTRESVKTQLIRELDHRAIAERDAGLRSYYKLRAAALRARGSGPLPWWAKDCAIRWGIE